MTGINRYGYDIEKIFDVILAFNSEASYEGLLDIILAKMMEITHSDAGTLYILEDNMLHFRITKCIGLNTYESFDEIKLPPILLDKDNIINICAYTAINNEIVEIGDVYTDERFNFQGPKNYDKITGYKTTSMLTLPLASQRNKYREKPEVLGVIQLLNAQDPITGDIIPYGDIGNPPVIPALANIAASTLENLTHTTEIRRLLHSFVAVLTGTIDERSAYTTRHTETVARYCEDFGMYLRGKFPEGHPYHFDEYLLEQLSIAALLHDIGKIVTPLEIMDKADRMGSKLPHVKYRFGLLKYQLENSFLKNVISEDEYAQKSAEVENALKLVLDVNNSGFLDDNRLEEVKKLADITYIDLDGNTVPLLCDEDMKALSIRKGTLTDEERAIMQDHASVTSRILNSVAFWKYYKNVPVWAGNHHELLDGSGYPRHLRNGELDIGSCIITIMDIYEALTAPDRPYRKANTPEAALNIVGKMAEEGKLHTELFGLFKDFIMEGTSR